MDSYLRQASKEITDHDSESVEAALRPLRDHRRPAGPSFCVVPHVPRPHDGAGVPLPRTEQSTFRVRMPSSAGVSAPHAARGARRVQPSVPPSSRCCLRCDGLRWEEVGSCGDGQRATGGRAGTEDEHGPSAADRPALPRALHAALHHLGGAALHRPRANRQPRGAHGGSGHPLVVGVVAKSPRSPRSTTAAAAVGAVRAPRAASTAAPPRSVRSMSRAGAHAVGAFGSSPNTARTTSHTCSAA